MFEATSLATTGLVVTVIPLVFWLLFKRRTYSPPLPPTPSLALPVIGHLHLLDKDTRVSFREFRKKCGDVYSIQLGNKLVVVISGYDAIKEGFKTNGDKFPARGTLPIIDKITRNMGKRCYCTLL